MNPYFSEVEVAKPGDFGGGNWNLRSLTLLTVLFGKNGSGKSRLLRSWRDKSPATSHYIVPERVGTLSFEPGYLQEQIDPNKRRETSQRNYAENYRQHIITRIQAYFLARGSVRDGEIPGDPSDLEKILSSLLPDFSLTIDGKKNPPYKLTRMPTGQEVTNIHDLSSGEAQILTVALDILTIGAIWDIEKTATRLILIDEPDAHIHPDLQVRFADFLVSVLKKFKLQVVVATHSTTLLAALGQFGGEETGIIYLDRITSDFRATSFTKEAKELAACLGGHALMGPLFGVPLLLVEGDDDYRIWSQVPRHHLVSFSVIPGNGDEIGQYQKSLERILAALREAGPSKAGYALIDGDKALPQANRETPQDHVQFIRLHCRESENLYLTDDVLSTLNTNWEAAFAKLTQRSAEFGEKALVLSNAANWNRRNQDIKSVINQITQILDEKNVHWTIRVARAIGQARPAGQLLEFLGADVVDALWGPQRVA